MLWKMRKVVTLWRLADGLSWRQQSSSVQMLLHLPACRSRVVVVVLQGNCRVRRHHLRNGIAESLRIWLCELRFPDKRPLLWLLAFGNSFSSGSTFRFASFVTKMHHVIGTLHDTGAQLMCFASSFTTSSFAMANLGGHGDVLETVCERLGLLLIALAKHAEIPARSSYAGKVGKMFQLFDLPHDGIVRVLNANKYFVEDATRSDFVAS